MRRRRQAARQLGFAEERVGVEPADQRMGLHAQRFRQWSEDVLPFEEPVRKEIQTGVFLDANERRQVVGKCAIDRVRADSTPVDPPGRSNDLLGAGIDAVLIGKDVDPESLDDAVRGAASAQGRRRWLSSDTRWPRTTRFAAETLLGFDRARRRRGPRTPR